VLAHGQSETKEGFYPSFVFLGSFAPKVNFADSYLRNQSAAVFSFCSRAFN
jgi:hypothetical protein